MDSAVGLLAGLLRIDLTMRFAWIALLSLCVFSAPLQLHATDTNGGYVETRLGKQGNATSITGYSTRDGRQLLFIAGTDGLVRPLMLGAPGGQWAWRNPIMRHHDGIVGLAAYYHPGDGRHHCFVALQTGDIWEAVFASLDDPLLVSENWLGKLEGGALAIAGVSSMDRSQHLFVAGRDGLVHPLEMGPATAWQWVWQAPVTSYHAGIVGIAAYYHSNDDAVHVFVALETGDIWEALAHTGDAWKENWLGVLDGGATGLAGYSAPNGLQHLLISGTNGFVVPLQIGPPHWKWRWDDSIMSHHDGIVGLTAYYHAGDDRQHVFAALGAGDIWESNSRPTTQVALREWSPKEFPISYWWGPPYAETTPPRWLGTARTRYQQVARAGFTFALPGEGDDVLLEGRGIYEPELNRKFLDAAGTAGLKAFIRDKRIDAVLAQRAPLTATMKQSLDSVIADYSGHSALAGYFLDDEPPVNGTEFPILSALVAYFRANDPGHACFINSQPIQAGAGEKYFEDYIATVKPFAVSYDHYSLLADGTDEPTFFENLDVVRRVSAKHDLPFWVIVLSIKHNNYRPPTEAEKRFEVMQTLAFGAKAVLYFTYWHPLPASVFTGTAIVNRDGSPSPQYDEVKSINADVRAIGKYLLPAKSLMVYENGVLPLGGTPVPAGAPVTFAGTAPITVGIFGKSPYAYVLLANRNYQENTSTFAKFQAAGLMRLDKATGSWVDVSLSERGLTQVTLSPGDAELYRLVPIVNRKPSKRVWKAISYRVRILSGRIGTDQ